MSGGGVGYDRIDSGSWHTKLLCNFHFHLTLNQLILTEYSHFMTNYHFLDNKKTLVIMDAKETLPSTQS